MRRLHAGGAVPTILTAAAVLVFVSAWTPGLASAPLPFLEAVKQWEGRMVTTGRTLCEQLGRPGDLDQRLGRVYYDAQRVFFQIADYTGDRSWEQCAMRAEATYRDQYVLRARGSVPGHWNFTHGLTMDYLRGGDRASREAVILLAQNAAFARDGTPLAWTASTETSREVAYAIMSYLNAERVGAAPRARLGPLVDQALGHLNQWLVARTAPVVTPFMVGLTAEALIAYHEKTRDDRIPPAIKLAMDWLWANAWMPSAEAFWYDSRDMSEAAPDLNLLIAPAYAWLFRQTGNPVYRSRGDQIFIGGVKHAWLGTGKHFNQNYRWSFDYLRWRVGR